MSNSREGSPDWLRCFQAPNQSFLTLSSDSEHSPTNNILIDDDDDDVVAQNPNAQKIQNQDTLLTDSLLSKPKSPKATQKRKGGNIVKGESAKEEETLDSKPVEPHVSSRLPLIMSEKVQRSKALVECEGESIDMSGDVGAVGRVVITDAPSGDSEMLLDLKGTIYKTIIVPSRTFCVVSFNQAEAKIEAVMNDFIQLKPISNVYEAETMIEGTLDGFAFDSDEEADKMSKPNAHQSDQKNEADELTNGKANGKAKKALGVTRKRGKAAGKPPKKAQKKTQGSKKAKK